VSPVPFYIVRKKNRPGNIRRGGPERAAKEGKAKTRKRTAQPPKGQEGIDTTTLCAAIREKGQRKECDSYRNVQRKTLSCQKRRRKRKRFQAKKPGKNTVRKLFTTEKGGGGGVMLECAWDDGKKEIKKNIKGLPQANAIEK